METEPGLSPVQQPVTLPTLAPLPFIPPPINFEPFEFFQLPFVPDPMAPPPPPGKLGPCDTPNGLPGPCAQGLYHPQANPCECVPFPAATTNQQQQQPKPPTGQQQPTTAPKPPTGQQQQPTAQQACPAGYCKHPQTGQCMQIPYGYTRHPQTQVCVLAAQQASPIPTEVETAFSDLKNLPWWVWAAGVGLVLLSGRGR
jgi:hypothetical protein